MGNNHNMWKKLLRKTFKKREEVRNADDAIRIELDKRRKGIIRTLIDDHRDAAMFRHALCAVYLLLAEKSSGKIPHYEDESGFIQIIFRETYRLKGRIKELEARIKEYEEKGVCLR